MARRVFYSFHYQNDSWRAGQVRNIGTINGSRPATDNQWEEVKKGGDKAIKQWISDQLSGRTCTIVLVGTNTARRKWINHEIIESWNRGMGVAGIHIHGLRDRPSRPRSSRLWLFCLSTGDISAKGQNPFDFIGYDIQQKLQRRRQFQRHLFGLLYSPFAYKKLSSVVECHDPVGETSRERYGWIAANIARIVEEAISIRNKNEKSIYQL